MSNTFILIIVAVVLIAGIQATNTVTYISQWYRRFDTVPFSAQEFYQQIEVELAERGIRKLSTTHSTYPQGGILSPLRDYLNIHFRGYIYTVCAAPIGNGYFVSARLAETGNLFRDWLISLPIVGRLFKRREKTFYELDSEVMIRELVHVCVQDAIESLTTNKGLRKLSEQSVPEYVQA